MNHHLRPIGQQHPIPNLFPILTNNKNLFLSSVHQTKEDLNFFLLCLSLRVLYDVVFAFFSRIISHWFLSITPIKNEAKQQT